MKEFNEKIKKTIDAELAKTPPNMKLEVDIVMEKEGIRLNFTRVKKEE
jgi:hypothetical protein